MCLVPSQAELLGSPEKRYCRAARRICSLVSAPDDFQSSRDFRSAINSSSSTLPFGPSVITSVSRHHASIAPVSKRSSRDAIWSAGEGIACGRGFISCAFALCLWMLLEKLFLTFSPLQSPIRQS